MLYYLEGSKTVEDNSTPKKMRKGTRIAMKSNKGSYSQRREKQMLKDLNEISELDRGKEYFRILKEKLYKALTNAVKRGFKSKKEYDTDKQER